MDQEITTEPTSTPPADPTKKSIVLAEDDPFISRMYQIKLEAAGYNVIMCSDGREAFESIKANRPKLVLLDINMPEMTGSQVYKSLQSSGYDVSSTQFLVLTNSGDPKDRKWATDAGLEFIIKADMTPKSVLDLINQKLSK